MVQETRSYAEGYVSGWNKCRSKICKKYNLDKSEVMAWENSDEDVNVLEGEQ